MRGECWKEGKATNRQTAAVSQSQDGWPRSPSLGRVPPCSCCRGSWEIHGTGRGMRGGKEEGRGGGKGRGEEGRRRGGEEGRGGEGREGEEEGR